VIRGGDVGDLKVRVGDSVRRLHLDSGQAVTVV
jgi:hypothetical protein